MGKIPKRLEFSLAASVFAGVPILLGLGVGLVEERLSAKSNQERAPLVQQLHSHGKAGNTNNPAVTK